MFVQWRFKILNRFGRKGNTIHTGRRKVNEGGRGIRVVDGSDVMFVYNPSGKRYDYVDYTWSSREETDTLSEITSTLEILGYITFVEKKEINGQSLKEQN